jgi:S1-C subfamily serine protease
MLRHSGLVLLLLACACETNAPATPAPSAAPSAAPTATAKPVAAPTTVAAPAADTPAAPAIAKPANADGQRPALGFMPEYDTAVEGVVVGAVREGGPAAKAGIEDGDVIVMLNGEAVVDARSYAEVLDEQTIGATVPVRIRRGQQQLELKVEIGARAAR